MMKLHFFSLLITVSCITIGCGNEAYEVQPVLETVPEDIELTIRETSTYSREYFEKGSIVTPRKLWNMDAKGNATCAGGLNGSNFEVNLENKTVVFPDSFFGNIKLYANYSINEDNPIFNEWSSKEFDLRRADNKYYSMRGYQKVKVVVTQKEVTFELKCIWDYTAKEE